MKYQVWISTAVLAAGIAALSSSAAGQASKAAPQTKPAAKAVPASGKAAPAAAKTFATPKTPWGDPDLQGVWNDATSTPLQRPTGVASKDVLDDEEAAGFEKQLAYDLTRDRRDG